MSVAFVVETKAGEARWQVLWVERDLQHDTDIWAQGNCPSTHLQHPTCYVAHGLGPTPDLASPHRYAYKAQP